MANDSLPCAATDFYGAIAQPETAIHHALISTVSERRYQLMVGNGPFRFLVGRTSNSIVNPGTMKTNPKPHTSFRYNHASNNKLDTKKAKV